MLTDKEIGNIAAEFTGTVQTGDFDYETVILKKFVHVFARAVEKAVLRKIENKRCGN